MNRPPINPSEERLEVTSTKDIALGAAIAEYLARSLTFVDAIVRLISAKVRIWLWGVVKFRNLAVSVSSYLVIPSSARGSSFPLGKPPLLDLNEV